MRRHPFQFWFQSGVCALIVIGSCFSFAKGKVRYPYVEYLAGQSSSVETVIQIVKREAQKSEKKKPLKKGSVLKDKASIQTSGKSEIRLALSPSATLVINENSQVQIPSISWKDGNVLDIIVKEGTVRYLCQKMKSEKCERTLKTAIYEVSPSAGDYLLRYSPTVPEVELTVLAGEAPFGGIENEKVVVLHPGEKASFKGVLENNEPAFDILLQGRRVAKGNASEVVKLSEEDLAVFEKQEVVHQKKIKTKPKSKRLESQICDKPWGELNQCAWVCESNSKTSSKRKTKSKAKNNQGCLVDQGAKCIRMRCNANGEWADRQELPASQNKCEALALVSACDY